jgi:hypothetical protein
MSVGVFRYVASRLARTVSSATLRTAVAKRLGRLAKTARVILFR